ncbi:MAG: maltotransferase domain-containing protein, partial [Mycobacteriaceae bacterium]
MTGRLAIDDVAPVVACSRHPAKAVVGEVIPVAATVWRDGHDAVAATVVWRAPGAGAAMQVPMVEGAEPDRFHGLLRADTPGLWSFRVDAWSDPLTTWRHAVNAKVGVGQGAAELANDLETGAQLLTEAARKVNKSGRERVRSAAAALRSD